MRTATIALASVAALTLGACATIPQAEVPPVPPATVAPAASAHDRLFAIFAADDEASLKLNPTAAIYRGDLRYADRLGDLLTPEYNAASKAQAEASLAALRTVDRAALSETDRIAYDVFEYQQRQALGDLAPEILALTDVRPLNHFSGFHTSYPTFASGDGAAPYKTVADYENSISRNADYVRIVDRAIARFREGMASGVLETRLTVDNMIEQLGTQVALKPEDTPFWTPVTKFPADFAPADKVRLAAATRASIVEVQAANARLRDFLRTEYRPLARTGYGLSEMKGGPALYARLIESSTTLPLSADYLHTLGLSEVARILSEMEKIKAQVGFKGDLAAFFEYLRDDPRFKPRTRQELTDLYYAAGRQVDAKVGEYFSTLPKAPLEIRPYPEFREKFEAGGSYEQGSPDGSRPGVFYFNAYDLPSRTTPGINTLYLHEGAPGHHFQISLAQENEALPAFMRFGGNTAYSEGWALYAETLGYPMGLYTDPYQHFGTLNDEMLRAMRLVVDTGIHAKGWSRDKAIAYMLANSGMGRTDATAEVERYIAIPGQALAYKVGALTIQRLRDKAKASLGDRFDIRKFHEQVLGTGALPLPVLEKKIDAWIAAGGN